LLDSQNHLAVGAAALQSAVGAGVGVRLAKVALGRPVAIQAGVAERVRIARLQRIPASALGVARLQLTVITAEVCQCVTAYRLITARTVCRRMAQVVRSARRANDLPTEELGSFHTLLGLSAVAAVWIRRTGGQTSATLGVADLASRTGLDHLVASLVITAPTQFIARANLLTGRRATGHVAAFVSRVAQAWTGAYFAQVQADQIGAALNQLAPNTAELPSLWAALHASLLRALGNHLA